MHKHKMRYFTKDLLVSEAKKAGVNNMISRVDYNRLEQMLDPSMLYPITLSVVDTSTVNCRIILSEHGESTVLKIPIRTWQNLPLQEVQEIEVDMVSAPPVS